jgi:hypothetical protein
MAKGVDLLGYWMPLLKELKEFKEIAKAEEPEITLLLNSIDNTINNMFIETADEYGISRFESMLGIFPEDSATLEERRFNVMVKWNDKLPYTEEALRGFLSVLCGEDGYVLSIDYNNYEITVKLGLESQNSYEEVQSLLDRMAPANLVRKVILFNTHLILSNYTHAELSNYTHQELREENL